MPAEQTSSIRIRILVPITSVDFRSDALAAAFSGTAYNLSTAFLTAGPVSVESAVDEVLAGPGVVAGALAAEAAGCSAMVIDCMLDPGLDAAREAVAIPVIGCGEYTMRQAAREAGKFSIITVLDRQQRLFADKTRLYGISDKLASVRSIDIPVLDLDLHRQKALTASIEQSARAVKEDGASAIVFGCTGMLGLGAPVAEALAEQGIDVPVYDPLLQAVRHAHDLVMQGASHNKEQFPYPQRKGYRGLSDWPELQALLLPAAGYRQAQEIK